MSFVEDNKQWICGKAGTVSLHRVSCIVRDIGEPCLHQSPIKISKMLKPDKWQATFDSDGKVFGFQKALKSIILGVPEDWDLGDLNEFFDALCKVEVTPRKWG
ncbi:hypothetical protein CsSME_00019888 [Camellia sinensis var. sinensis]